MAIYLVKLACATSEGRPVSSKGTALRVMAQNNPSVSRQAAFNKYCKKDTSSGKKWTFSKDEIKGCGASHPSLLAQLALEEQINLVKM